MCNSFSPFPFKILRVRGWCDHTCWSILSSSSLFHPLTPPPSPFKILRVISYARLFFLPLPCFIPLYPLTLPLPLTPSPFKISAYLHLNSLIQLSTLTLLAKSNFYLIYDEVFRANQSFDEMKAQMKWALQT